MYPCTSRVESVNVVSRETGIKSSEVYVGGQASARSPAFSESESQCTL